MPVEIRSMMPSDKGAVLSMMRTFYASPAVSTNGSEEIFLRDFEACVGENLMANGFVFEADGEIAGYGMITFGFSTEFGKPVVWIEDIYVRENFRGQGIGSRFLKHIETLYPAHLHRLEAERENVRALDVYRKNGFSELPYVELCRNSSRS